MEASDPVGATQKGAGMRRGRFEKGKRKNGEKKVRYLLFHPPLYSSRHGNMPGGHSREASSLAKTTERQGVSESNPQPKQDRLCTDQG